MAERLFQMWWDLDEPWLGDMEITRHLRIDVNDGQFFFHIQRRRRRGDDGDWMSLLVSSFVIRETPGLVADILDGTRAEPRVKGIGGTKDGLDPAEYRQFVATLVWDLRHLANHLLSSIMWRAGVIGGPIDLGGSSHQIRWQPSADGHDFDEEPFLAHELRRGVMLLDVPWPREWPGLVSLGSMGSQPLYHNLLREAFANRETHPRSSLVMCVAAIETGLKTLVTDLLPQTTWIIENLQSPSVVKMIRELLPQLPAKNLFGDKVVRPTKNAISAVQKAVELRNKLVHGSAADVPSATLETLLSTARELLYLFDYYRGESWAREFITSTVVAEVASPG